MKVQLPPVVSRVSKPSRLIDGEQDKLCCDACLSSASSTTQHHPKVLKSSLPNQSAPVHQGNLAQHTLFGCLGDLSKVIKHFFHHLLGTEIKTNSLLQGSLHLLKEDSVA